jgi:glucuronosyltransferase
MKLLIIYFLSFRENMKTFSTISKDVPDKPLDRAVWWAEYVLRHNGARHLRSAALDLTWYQYLLLDVIAAILLTCLVVLYLSYITVRRLSHCLVHHCSSKTEQDFYINSTVTKKFD